MVAATVAALGCAKSADSAKLPDGAAVCVHPTPPSHLCLARWCDNVWHVGMPCTNGGGQCKVNADLVGDGSGGLGAVLCTAAFSSDLAFCTKPCGSQADCGPGASCEGDDKSGHGCVPSACVDQPAGPDAMGSDATSLADAATK